MNKLLPALAALLAAAPLAAKDYTPFHDRYGHQFEDEKPWNESEVRLPPYPDAAQGEWIDLYVSETYGKQVRVALPPELSSDGSLRYVIAVQAGQGRPNYSYEGLRCKDRFHRPFAFGDNSNSRWIESRSAQWRHFDNYRAASDPARGRLVRILCEDGTPKDAAEAEQRLRSGAGRS